MRTKMKQPEIQNTEQRTQNADQFPILHFAFYILSSAFCLLSLFGCDAKQGAIPAWGLDTSTDRSNDWQKFPSADRNETTAVESAIALSDKYAKLSEEATALRQARQTLDAENRKLKEDLQGCRTRLEQAQKELDEVNDLLVEMRLELNNWKSDVLGFREEMRDAEKAQLEALLKVLKLLGGEVKTEQPRPEQPAKQD